MIEPSRPDACNKCHSWYPCECFTEPFAEENYLASLQAERRERKKSKLRVRLIIGDKVHSFPVPEGCPVALEIVRAGEVIDRLDVFLEEE